MRFVHRHERRSLLPWVIEALRWFLCGMAISGVLVLIWLAVRALLAPER
jgi:hypothetical protein